jgi:hypothetical protein
MRYHAAEAGALMATATRFSTACSPNPKNEITLIETADFIVPLVEFRSRIADGVAHRSCRVENVSNSGATLAHASRDAGAFHCG